jgi:hypothetical protein
VAERIMLISEKERDLKMGGKLRRHAEGLTGEIFGVHPKVAFFIHCGGPQGHYRLVNNIDDIHQLAQRAQPTQLTKLN